MNLDDKQSNVTQWVSLIIDRNKLCTLIFLSSPNDC